MINILLYVCHLLFLFSYSLEEAQASEIQFHTLDLSAHLSSTLVCNRASTNGSKKRASSSSAAVLEVVHKQGPCAPKNTQIINISSAEMLAEDQLRVQSIHKSHDYYKGEDKEARLRVQPGNSLGTGNYIVKIGFGTPAQTFSVVFDTGSDVTWIQCLRCPKNGCYRQEDPMFKPSASTSYSKFRCTDRECKDLNKYEGESGCYLKSTCVYIVRYGDGSQTTGFYSKEQLTLTPGTDVIPGFRFGCGHNNTGLFGRAAGLLGLGRSPTSFVYQTAKMYSLVFSYCIPDYASTGFLSFGGKYYNNNNKNNKNKAAMMITTPLLPAPPPRRGEPPLPFYYVEITALWVGRQKLNIQESVFTTAGAIVDSGTVITRLPLGAYKALSKEFRKQLRYKPAPAFNIMDTCFDISNLTYVTLPTISITFGGKAAKLDLAASGIIYIPDPKRACLAFAANADPTDVAIFGNRQQTELQVIFDVPGKKVGFISNSNCKL